MRYPELQTLEAWTSTSETRRQQLAEEVAREHSLVLERVAPFRRTTLPLASYRGLDGLFRFVLVPGGTYRRGLSDEEHTILEQRARAQHANLRIWATKSHSGLPTASE